jgi:hypothetical protein
MLWMPITYEINTDAFGNRWIQCLICGLGSYNANDIEQKYCCCCHLFHEDVSLSRRAAPAY